MKKNILSGILNPRNKKHPTFNVLSWLKSHATKRGVLISCAALLLIVACAIIIPKISTSKGGTLSTVSKSSLEKVIEINDLSTLDYTYNAITSVYDDDGEKLKYYVAYEGTVTAGIDFSKMEITQNADEKKIIITLPEVEIQNTSVDMGSMDYIFIKDKYETETVSQEAYKASMDDLAKSARKESSLLSMAKDNAIATINALISPWVKQLDQEYIVEIR